MDVGVALGQETHNMLTFPSVHPPKPEKSRKRLKLIHRPPETSDIAQLRQQICEHKQKCQAELKEVYRDNLTELFYLQNGLNFMDSLNLKKKPNIHLKNYLRSLSLDEAEKEKGSFEAVKEEPSSVAMRVEDPLTATRQVSSQSTMLKSHGDSDATAEAEVKAPTSESIMEQAKKEAHVMQRVGELRKKGLWSARRMPKIQEPARNKAHWDYLLEEMQWLAADFAQERKWKKAGCRKISRMITRYHMDRVDDEKRAEKEEGGRLRRIAGQLSKQIKDFWSNIEKVVQYKHDSRLDEKRRQALDMHLNFIVDQTEKYSSWLSAGLGAPGSGKGSSTTLSPSTTVQEDFEFQPNVTSDDDEETIAKEEELNASSDQGDVDAEIAALQAESEIPIDELLASLPKEMLDRDVVDTGDKSSSEDVESSCEDFNGDASDAVDDENTLDEQETQEDKNYKDELSDLRNEGEMTVEELAAKYADAYASDFELPDTPSSTEVEDSDDGDDENETSSDEESEQDGEDMETGDQLEEIGMEYLLHPEKDEKDILSSKDGDGNSSPNREITEIAAAAQSLQPTGYTLETTVVKTPIPFLLKHTLREYQHVGLDWLATMYEKKLNGILADEMGLGKTIQTIALLAHLACEHSVWGPHLIVVPTSVMLNWEMELKKWCPGFKILTYYGSQKERKLKRVGWTKTNAFHVCITSYKLVIQDHIAFKRKKWKYLILDEAQNIKNFKSQRWQTLLNFNSQRRLLLTGTPLQNNLMELWSLMHFLMPSVFQSHMEFKEWFANPLTGMIEGTSEYSEQLIRRLHKVLRPFLLRRLKADVEKQMPKKYEHVVMCRLSKRQRFLYEEFMSRRATKETLSGGNFMSVINILMQLRKVCNHPDMFDPRPIISPYETDPISVETASAVLKALDYDPLEHIKLDSLYPNLANLELTLSAYAAHRSRKLQTPKRLIEVIDDESDPPIRPPPTKLRPFVIRSPTPSQTKVHAPTAQTVKQSGRAVSITSSIMKATMKPQLSNLVSQSSKPPVAAVTTTTTTSQPITLQIQQTPQGTRLMIPSSQLSQLQAGLVHIIQTSSGQHLITSTANAQTLAANNSGVTTSSGISKVLAASSIGSSSLTSSGAQPTMTKLTSTTAASSVATVEAVAGKPVLKTVTSSGSSGLVTVVASSSSSTSRPAGATHTPTVVTSAPVRTLPVPNGTTVTPSISKVSSAKSGTIAAPVASTAHGSKSKVPFLGPASRKRARENEARSKFVAELSLDEIELRRNEWRSGTLNRLAVYNRKHCSHRPVYGVDLHEAVDVWSRGLHAIPGTFQSNSAVHCLNASRVLNANHPRYYWNSTSFLNAAILSREQRLQHLQNVLERFVFLTPPVKSPGVSLHAACQSNLLSFDRLVDNLSRRKLVDSSKLLHPIQTRMLVQFPEKRLIQYDCGKLQTLDVLLRRLKSGTHRVLIFTQMTKMLDILENFLNYHGHRYLRLDGTTKVEMRQQLMDRFNADPKIFVFILSTRSGGIGVNLTGADTVIFYDSDWNPTMDAQAQDRCHRIGQTRDVHIYRLVSEKTVEENILKKANQKRMLGDVAIEGGNFTTASLQQGTITDLFAEPSGLQSLAEHKRSRNAASSSISLATSLPTSAVSTNLNEKQFEQALCQAEDAEDVQAAAVASEEAGAELAEFDESIPWDEREAELKKQQCENTSKVEQEIAMLEKELTPVERLAVAFLENTDEQFSEEALKEAELDIEQSKKEWELNRLKDQRQEEERKADLEEDDMLYTYSKEDGMNQAFKDSVTGENMPMWCPPTPPHTENDVYVDQSTCFLYDTAIMTESQLPPVYVKKEKKRRHEAPSGGIPKKKLRLVVDEMPQQTQPLVNRPPRSLFDRAPNAKARREKTLLRHGMAVQLGMKMGASGNLQRPGPSDSSHQDQPEWLIHEDWSLLQAVQTLLQLPLNLIANSPAHIPNWDLVSDIVNTTSRIYRSAKQCKLRYEAVIIPREEGKLNYDANPRKPSKKIPKSVYKTKGNKPMRTGQLYTQDSGSSVTTLHAFRFDCIKNVASKRTPTLRPTLVNPTMKNPKHAAVIAESGIQYDSPLNPEEVAKIRQERIKNEKTKAAEQQRAAATQAVRTPSAVQLQHIPASGATAIISPATTAAIRSGGVVRSNSIVVSNSYTLNRKLPSQGTSVISGNVAQPATRKMTVQEIQQLRSSSTTVAQFMKQVQAAGGGISQGGTPRTITVQQQSQQPISIGGVKQPQYSQLNILSQHQAKQQQRVAGATLVQRAGTSQLLTSQQLQQTNVDPSRVPTLVKTVSSAGGATFGTTNMTIPVSTGVNINVSLPQQQKVQGAISKASLTGAQPQQYKQIQLLHKQGGRPLTQKLSLTHPHQLVGKAGGPSVQIVQQKIGHKSIGVQQIQQLIKQQQQQSQQQHAQIIATPAAVGSSATGGQTIIATTQLITPANMHATITKMSAPNSSSGGVSNVTVSLARPVITSTSPVTIVPGPGGASASLVTQSPSKLVATTIARPTTHRVAGAITGIVGGGSTGSTPVVSLASVTLQGLQNPQSSLVNQRTLSANAIQAFHQAAVSQNAARAASVVSNPVSSTAGTTVLQQTILTNKPVGTSTPSVISVSSVVQQQSTPTPPIVSQTLAPPVVVPVQSQPQAATITNIGSTVTVATTPSVGVFAPKTPVVKRSTPSPPVLDRSDSPVPDLSDLQTSTPDATRTYAMRPRKTN